MFTKATGLALVLALPPLLAISAPVRSQNAPTQSTAQEMREKVRAACAADIARHCADVERAKGAMRQCMVEHETQLSDGCKAARAERAAARAKEKG